MPPFDLPTLLAEHWAGDIKAQVRAENVYTLNRSIELFEHKNGFDIVWDESFIEILAYFSAYYSLMSELDAESHRLRSLYEGFFCSILAEKALSKRLITLAVGAHFESRTTIYHPFRLSTAGRMSRHAYALFELGAHYCIKHELGHIWATENSDLISDEIKHICDAFLRIRNKIPDPPAELNPSGGGYTLEEAVFTGDEDLLKEFGADFYFALSMTSEMQSPNLKSLSANIEAAFVCTQMMQSLLDTIQIAEASVNQWATGNELSPDVRYKKSRQYEARMSFLAHAMMHSIQRRRDLLGDIASAAECLAKAFEAGEKRQQRLWRLQYPLIKALLGNKEGDGGEAIWSMEAVGRRCLEREQPENAYQFALNLLGWDRWDERLFSSFTVEV